jgi:DNA repair exonuclease SbcCD ATPase subunit
MENKHLQKSIGDMEAVILDVNCTNSKLHDENKSLKERLEKESEKCNDLTSHLRTLRETETALSERSQEIITLKKQLVSLHKFVDKCLKYSGSQLKESHLR